MRIGVDARSLTEHQPSGISVYTLHVVEAMVKVAPHHTFVLFTSGAQVAATVLLKRLVEHSNVEHVHVGWPNKLFHSAAWLGLTPRIERWLGDIDVLFAPNIHIIPRHIAPLVITVHDLTYELFTHCLSGRRKLWHRIVNPRRLLASAQQCITVSHSTAHDLHTVYGIANQQISPIHSAIPQPDTPEPLTELPDNFALVLSTVEPRKNIAATMQAYLHYYKDHPESDLELVVIGSSGWKSATLIEQMEQHSRIHYIGYATAGQKQQALQQASMLLYPSLYEGFGFPPLEAMREECPVIASRVGALPEILESGVYYVDPYSIADIASGIHAVYSDTALRQQLTTKASQVIKKLSWNDTAEQTLKVLENSI